MDTLKKRLQDRLNIKLKDREFPGGQELFLGEDECVRSILRENFSAFDGVLQDISITTENLSREVAEFYKENGYGFIFGFSEIHHKSCVSTHSFFRKVTETLGAIITYDMAIPNIYGSVSIIPGTLEISMRNIEPIHDIQEETTDIFINRFFLCFS